MNRYFATLLLGLKLSLHQKTTSFTKKYSMLLSSMLSLLLGFPIVRKYDSNLLRIVSMCMRVIYQFYSM